MSVSHSREPTTFSSYPSKTPNPVQECHFYVIDSDNQQQLHQNIHKNVVPPIKVVKERCLSQPYSNSLEEQYIDKEIKTAEEEVKRLQKQCLLLESLLSNMASQQAKLLVEMRVKERRKSVDATNGRMHKLSCPMHKNQIDPINQNMVLFNPTIPKAIAEAGQDISFTTPLLSRNHFSIFHNKKLDETSTVEIKESTKKDRQTQAGTRKISTKKNQNKPPSKNKTNNTINTIKVQKLRKNK